MKSSALRAFLIIFFVEMTRIYKLGLNRLKLIFLAFFIILLFMPYRAIDLSLTLSFISILSLFYLKDILFINVKKDSNLIKAFKTILTVNISLLPLILYYYGSVNLLLIPVNLIVVPIFSATFALVF